MNKLFLAAFVAAITSMPALPALADGDSPEVVTKTSTKAVSKSKPAATKTASKSSSSDDINFGDVLNGLSYTGARLVKCGVGLVGGTPVAMFRKTLRTTHDTSKSVVGDNKNEACSILTEALMLPVGVIVGSVDGLGWSVENSWKNSEHVKPFDLKKDLFSLGSLDE